MKTKRHGFDKLTNHGILSDYIKAAKRGSREAEMEIKGPGFHSMHKVHKSKKTYTRKLKHKNQEG